MAAQGLALLRICKKNIYRFVRFMTALSKHNGTNLAGIEKIEFAATEQISTVVYSPNYEIRAFVVFEEGYDWQPIPFTQDSAEVLEPEEDTEQGMLYLPRIPFRIPKDYLDRLQFLGPLEYCDFIVKVTDKNGFAKLYGTVEQPMQFRKEIVKQGNVPSRNAYLCEFYGRLTDASPAYSASLATEFIDYAIANEYEVVNEECVESFLVYIQQPL